MSRPKTIPKGAKRLAVLLSPQGWDGLAYLQKATMIGASQLSQRQVVEVTIQEAAARLGWKPAH